MAFKHFWVQYKLGQESDQAYIKSDNFVIGRAPECELPIPTDVISRRHLKVYLEENKILVMDLGSTNGTFLQGERLEANKKYEYKTGNRLYIDANKEVSLRITAIYQRDAADLAMDKTAIELERKRQEIKGKSAANRRLKDEGTEIGAKSQFLASAADSADNIFDNILFIAKSARFNKEKQIKEAEYQSQELLEKAQEDIEAQREKFQSDIRDLKVRTENEAKRTVTSANKKADKIIQNAESRARQLKQEIADAQKEAREAAENERKNIIEEAQERHGEIIAEAHLRNRELQDENRKMESTLGEFNDRKQRLLSEIDDLKQSVKEHEELAIHTKKSYSDELSGLNALRLEVSELEQRNQKALFDLEKKIPGLKEQVQQMEERLVGAKVEIRDRQEEAGRIEKSIADSRLAQTMAVKNAEVAQGHLEEISKRLVEAEDDLNRQVRLHEERAEALEKQIEERTSRQKELEEKVNERILKKKENSEKEIAVNVANAREKVQEMLAGAQTQSEETIESAKQKAEATVKEAEHKAGEKISQAEREASLVLTEAKAEAQRVTTESDKIKKQMEEDLKKKYAEADARSKQLREEAEKFSKEMRLEADQYRAKVKGDGDTYASQTRNEARAYSQNVKEEADKYKAQHKLEADSYTKQKKMEADAYSSERREQADKYALEIEEKADSYNEKVKKEADQYSRKVREEADIDINSRRKNLQIEIKTEKDKLLSDSRREAKDIIEGAKAEAKEILKKTQGEASDRIAELESEIEKRKKETDQEINEIRTHAVKKLEEQKVQFELDEKERNRVRVLKLRKELSDVLRARITPFLKDTDQIDKVSSILGKTINSIMLDEVDDDFLDAENFSDIDPTIAQKKNIKFFVGTAMALVIGFTVLYLLPTFKEMAKESGRDIAAEMEKEQQQKIKRLQEQKEADRWIPDTVTEYKESYTDRVLFTENYVKVELNKEFREKWILELQDFFIYELRLNETQLVPFIASEANLISELNSAKEQISKQYQDQGVVRMRQIEEEFVGKLRANLKKPVDLKRVMDFKKKFFEENKALGL